MIANSVQHEISLILEPSYGVTPATPAAQLKAITGTSIALTKNKITSGTINPNRQVMDVRHGNRAVGGDIMTELIFGEQDDMLQAVFCGTWTANVLVPGTVRRSFSVLRHYTDLPDSASPYHLAKGIEFNHVVFAVAPEKIVTAQFAVMGREITMGMAAPTGIVYTDPSALKPFDSFTGSITVDGSEVAIVTGLSLTLENGLTVRNVVFDDRTIQPKIGRTTVTGSLTLFFETSAFLMAFNGAQKRALSFNLIDLDGNEYQFDLPSILGTGGQADVSEEADITITYPFSAIYEVGAGTPDVLKLTRIPA